MMKERLKINDNIKTAMMLTVVLYHSCMFFTGTWFDKTSPVFEANYIAVFARYLNTFHVQTFTMASGFLFYALKKEKGKYSNNIKGDIIKRAKRLLFPYFSTIIFWVLPFYIVFSGFNLGQIIYKYVLGCSPSQLWFLPMLFWLFVSAYFVFSKHKPNMIGLLLCILISIGGGDILDKIGCINILQIKTALGYAMFYYLGTFLYEKNIKLSVKSTICFIVLSISGFTFSSWEIEKASFVIKLFEVLARNVGFISGVFMIYGIAVLLGNNIGMIGKIWKWLGVNSFGIYLFHQQLIYPCIMILNGRVHPIIQVFLSFFIAVVLSSMMTITLRKWKITSSIFYL